MPVGVKKTRKAKTWSPDLMQSDRKGLQGLKKPKFAPIGHDAGASTGRLRFNKIIA
jgi:hypothetical protein